MFTAERIEPLIPLLESNQAQHLQQDHRQGRVGAHPAYSRHMPSGRVGVLFGFFSGPGGWASSEDTCPMAMGGWADVFLDRAPVGVARFYEKLPRAKFPVLKKLKIFPNSLALFVR